MLIFEIVDRLGKVRATYCMREDAEHAIKHDYPACRIRELTYEDQPKGRKK